MGNIESDGELSEESHDASDSELECNQQETIVSNGEAKLALITQKLVQ